MMADLLIRDLHPAVHQELKRRANQERFALTDAAYRAEFDARVMTDIQRIMAVRSVYLAVPGDGDPSGRPPS